MNYTNSTNGTYINEVLVGKGATQTLQEGQELSLVLGVTDRPTGLPPPIKPAYPPRFVVNTSDQLRGGLYVQRCLLS
jgi:hypothetical protein